MALIKGNKEITLLTKIPSKLAEKTITKDGVYNATDDNLDGYNKVTVEIDSSYLAGSYDRDGLKKIGWTDADIDYYNQHGVQWTASENDYYKLTDEDLKGVQYSKTAFVRFMPKNYSFRGNEANSWISLIALPVPKNELTASQLLFDDCYCLTTIPMLNTSKISQFRFKNCTSLREIPLIDTSKATSMSEMFCGCNSLQRVPLLNTSNVTSMYRMFENCRSLKDIPNFDTSKVTNMNGMFYGCGALRNIPNFDTSKVTDMSGMFRQSGLIIAPTLNTSSVTNMRGMFQDCNNLTTADLREYNVSNVTDMSDMFSGCQNLDILNIQGWDTSKVTEMGYMFAGCGYGGSLKPTFNIDGLNTSSVTDMSRMFSNQNKYGNTEYILNFDTPNVIDISYMFGFSYGNLIQMKNADFSKVTSCNNFAGEIKSIKLNDHHNLGEAFLTTVSANYYNYRFSLRYQTSTPKENLVEIINGLYDIKTKGVKAQLLTLGSTNIAKLTSEEIAVATNKGWTVS